jgi:DNA-binding transcriptional regulator LsrR (DeoR family)
MIEAKDRLLYKVLKRYYEDGLTQQEIAVKYGISRIKVSRLISKALNDKIVQIKINKPDDPSGEMENSLEETFGLQEAIVVKTSSGNIIDELGKATAGYLSGCLQGNETIGLTWGRALLASVNALTTIDYPNIKVVQMLGGLGDPDSDTHGTDLTVRLAQLFRGKARLLNSPGIVRTKEIRDSLLSEIQISETLKLADKIDIALVGVGSLKEDALIVQKSQIISQQETDRLLGKGAVGDIGLRFFNENGTPVNDEINERVIGFTYEQIKCIPRVIGIAGGESKHKSILAAIRAKLINVLITDDHTAKYLIHNK